MHILCPHCRNPIELVRLPSSGEVLCTACGSTFRIESESTQTWGKGGRSTLGRFELVGLVGTGAFGSVYKARDPRLDRVVALKIPRGEVLAGSAERDRFLREARSAAQLRHPAIAAVHEVGQDGETTFLVSDFIDGVNLADRLSAGTPSFRESAGIVAAAAEALEEAHGQGVVHRDVKPSNIMLRPDGSPVLLDFGLAKRDAGEVTMTMDGQVLGTPAYMSPEQARGEGHSVDGRSDVYSLRVVLYHLLTGELPFRGNTRMLLHQVLHDDPRPPRRLNDRIPRDLETVTMKAMAKEPSGRYATAGELGADLRRYLSGEPIKARPVGALERLYRWGKRRPAIAGLASLVVLVTALSFAIVGNQLRVTQRALGVATKAEGEAQEARQAEQLQRQKTEASLYPGAIALANRALAVGDPDRVRTILDELPPRLRGWEWNYLARRAKGAILTFREHQAPLTELALQPGGNLVATADESGLVLLWNPDDGRVTNRLTGHTGKVLGLAFSPDGRRLATAGLDRTIRIWDALEGRSLKILNGHTGSVRCLSFSSDGSRLASGGWDNTARLWDLEKGTEIRSFGPLPGWVNGVSLAPGGLYLAASWGTMPPVSSEWRFAVDVWQTETGKVVHTSSDPGDATRVWEFESTPTTGIGVEFKEVRNPNDKNFVGRLRRRDPARLSCESNKGHRALATGDWDSPAGTIYFPNESPGGIVLTTPRRFEASLRGHTGWVIGMHFLQDGHRLVSASRDGTARVWDADPDLDRGDRTLNGLPGGPIATTISPDGELAAALGSGQLRVWETRLGRTLMAARVRMRHSPVLEFTPDGLHLLAVDRDGVYALWDVKTWRDPIRFEEHRQSVIEAVLSKDGSLLAVALALDLSGTPAIGKTSSRPILVFETASGRVRQRLEGFTEMVLALDFSPDGRRLVAVGGRPDRPGPGLEVPGEVKAWDIETGRLIHDLRGHDSYVMSLGFHPKGDRLATGSADRTVRIWDLNSGEQERLFTGHSGRVDEIAFSRDGNLLATRGLDRTLQLWDPDTGRARVTIRGQERPPNMGRRGIAFTPDGRRIASVIGDRIDPNQPGRIVIYDVSDGQEMLTLSGHSSTILDLVFSPDGARLVTAGQGGALRIWEASASDGVRSSIADYTTEPVHPDQGPGRTLWGHETRVVDVAILPDDRIFSVDAAGKAFTWDLTGKRLSGPQDARGSLLNRVSLASAPRVFNGDRMYVGDSQGAVWFCSFPKLLSDRPAEQVGFRIGSSKGEGRVKSLAVSPDRAWIASSFENGWTRLWSADLQSFRYLPNETYAAWALAFSPDSKTLVAAKDTGITTWDVANLRMTLPPRNLQSWIRYLVWSPEGSTLGLTTSQRSVITLDPKTNEKIWEHHEILRGGYTLAFSPDGSILAVGSSLGMVTVYATQDGHELAAWPVHSAQVNRLAFSRDGTRLASASDDGTVEILEAPKAPAIRPSRPDKLPERVFAP